jgi:hypothetical protein
VRYKANRHYIAVLVPFVVLVVVVAFLPGENGIMARDLLARWWPLLLIVVGVRLVLAKYKRNEN